MSKRYIDANALWKRITSSYDYIMDVTDVLEEIQYTPTADVVERERGKWIWMGEKGDSRFMCSVCKSKENVPTCNGEPTIWWFCPNCGADMREEMANK